MKSLWKKQPALSYHSCLYRGLQNNGRDAKGICPHSLRSWVHSIIRILHNCWLWLWKKKNLNLGILHMQCKAALFFSQLHIPSLRSSASVSGFSSLYTDIWRLRHPLKASSFIPSFLPLPAIWQRCDRTSAPPPTASRGPSSWGRALGRTWGKQSRLGCLETQPWWRVVCPNLKRTEE